MNTAAKQPLASATPVIASHGIDPQPAQVDAVAELEKDQSEREMSQQSDRRSRRVVEKSPLAGRHHEAGDAITADPRQR
jgi:hypothetical protein